MKASTRGGKLILLGNRVFRGPPLVKGMWGCYTTTRFRFILVNRKGGLGDSRRVGRAGPGDDDEFHEVAVYTSKSSSGRMWSIWRHIEAAVFLDPRANGANCQTKSSNLRIKLAALLPAPSAATSASTPFFGQIYASPRA